MQPRAPVWVVGSLNVDLVVGVRRHPAPGETVLGGDLRRFPGGKGANQAAAAALAGGDRVRVRMLGRVGDDAEAGHLREALGARGVDLEGVRALPGVTTGVALIAVDEEGQNAIVVAPGANGRLAASDLADMGDLAGCHVLTQLETPLPTVEALAERCRAAGAALVLNAAPAATLPPAVLASVDTLVVNEHEAAATGAPPAPAGAVGEARRAWARGAAEALLGLGPVRAVVTVGRDGAAWAGPGVGDASGAVASGAAAAPEVDAVDTTGAGDAFCGAFVAARALGTPLAEAVAFGQAAGALASTAPGAMPSMPRREAVLAFLRAAEAASR